MDIKEYLLKKGYVEDLDPNGYSDFEAKFNLLQDFKKELEKENNSLVCIQCGIVPAKKGGCINRTDCNYKNQPAVIVSLPKSCYYQCKECSEWRMIGTFCKNPMTNQCDKNERYFYRGNDR